MRLPKRVEITEELAKSKQLTAVADALSDTFGFCIFSLDTEQADNGKWYVVNINWDLTD